MLRSALVSHGSASGPRPRQPALRSPEHLRPPAARRRGDSTTPSLLQKRHESRTPATRPQPLAKHKACLGSPRDDILEEGSPQSPSRRGSAEEAARVWPPRAGWSKSTRSAGLATYPWRTGGRSQARHTESQESAIRGGFLEEGPLDQLLQEEPGQERGSSTSKGTAHHGC